MKQWISDGTVFALPMSYDPSRHFHTPIHLSHWHKPEPSSCYLTSLYGSASPDSLFAAIPHTPTQQGNLLVPKASFCSLIFKTWILHIDVRRGRNFADDELHLRPRGCFHGDCQCAGKTLGAKLACGAVQLEGIEESESLGKGGRFVVVDFRGI